MRKRYAYHWLLIAAGILAILLIIAMDAANAESFCNNKLYNERCAALSIISVFAGFLSLISIGFGIYGHELWDSEVLEEINKSN